MPINRTGLKKDGQMQYRVRVNYTDKTGKHCQIERTAYGRQAAQELEAKLKEQIAQPALAAPQGRTVQQLYDEYIISKASEVRQSTLAKHKSILTNHVLPTLGKLELTELTTPIMQDWKNTIAAKDLQIKMRQNTYKELRALLNYAVRLDYLLSNPLLKVGNFRDAYQTKPADELRYYTKEQFVAYAAAARDSANTLLSWSMYVFFCIAYYTGMRKGEINALRWSDIDGGTLHVRRSVNCKTKGEAVVETPPKNKSSYRDLQMPAPLISILREHKKRQQQDKRWCEDWRICGGPDCLRDTTISHYNDKYAALAGLPHIRIHDFRHSHASLLCNEGINIQEVARRLGHADVQMTWNTYSHLYPREEERAVEVLNQIVF